MMVTSTCQPCSCTARVKLRLPLNMEAVAYCNLRILGRLHAPTLACSPLHDAHHGKQLVFAVVVNLGCDEFEIWVSRIVTLSSMV